MTMHIAQRNVGTTFHKALAVVQKLICQPKQAYRSENPVNIWKATPVIDYLMRFRAGMKD